MDNHTLRCELLKDIFFIHVCQLIFLVFMQGCNITPYKKEGIQESMKWNPKLTGEGEEKSVTHMNEEARANDGKVGENGHMLGT